MGLDRNIMMEKINMPPYSNFPTFANQYVLLREIVISDLSDLIEISFYDAVQAQTLDQAITMHLKIEQDYQAGNSIHWGVIDQRSGKIVGTCGYYRGFANNAGELGCVLLPQYRGKGLMSVAIQLAIDFGWTKIGLNRIWAATDADNDKAINLLKNLGFIKIGSNIDQNVEFELPLN